jgi:integrase
MGEKIMNKEKLQYNNISEVKINGKIKYRFKYKGADNKYKYLTSVKKKLLIPEVVKKVETDGFKITDFNYWSMEDAHQLWLDRQNKKQLQYSKPSKSCIRDYNSMATYHILPFFKGEDARLIDKASITSFVSFLEKKDSINAKTLSKVFNVLSAILDYSAAKNKIGRNVCKDLDYLADVVVEERKFAKLDFEEWSLDRVKNLIAEIKRADIELMFSIMLETACRPSEVRALNRSHLKFKSNSPYLKIESAVKRDHSLGLTKNKKTRDLVISSSLKDKIQDHLNKMPFPQEFLFVEASGNFISLFTLIRALDKACRCLEVVLPINRKCYFFRHYMATYWAWKKKYTDPQELADALGDSDVNFVRRTYIKPYANTELEKGKSDWQNQQFNN